MSGIIVVNQYYDGKEQRLFESDAMPWEEVTETLKVLMKPSMFGDGEVYAISVLVVM